MASSSAIHVVTTSREYKGKVYRTHLLRRSVREGDKVKKETVANISSLGDSIVQLVRQALKGEKFVRVEDAFDVVGSRHHGHAAAVVQAMRQLKVDKLLGPDACRERQLVLAMIAARIVDPRSKLSTATCLNATTLPELLDARDATEDELYAAMDWLLERQDSIEKKLGKRHLREGAMALYDLTSSYFEGTHCPLAARGYNRDGKKRKLQVNYGLLTDRRGCPVAVSVFKGNTADPATVLPQVHTLRQRFDLDDFVLVGDRGMISQKQVDALRDEGGQWITALRPGVLRKLVEDRSIQPTLFDQRNLAEIQHEDFPGERLVVCRNPELANRRAANRDSLLRATETELQKIQQMVEAGKLRGEGKIGVRAGRVVNKFKVAKHFQLDIGDRHLRFERNARTIEAEAALDGLYVVRTSLPQETMDSDEVVRSYKQLTQVERCFRAMKTMDLRVRPIYHRTANRVRAHILLCMLAYYVQWHMLEAWRPLLFSDEELDDKLHQDPVVPAERSSTATKKAATKRTDDGHRVHSFQALLTNLSTIVRNTCRRPAADASEPEFYVDTKPTELQQKALDLIAKIQM